MLQSHNNKSSLVLAQTQTKKSVEQNRELRNWPIFKYGNNIWWVGAVTKQGEGMDCFVDDVGRQYRDNKTGSLYGEK